ncbi:hypothetical protein TNCV_3912461 [Trichonephila clavipes]|nr:hypothetical protein TNCV_3912461 [Trichonephila clavipes]
MAMISTANEYGKVKRLASRKLMGTVKCFNPPSVPHGKFRHCKDASKMHCTGFFAFNFSTSRLILGTGTWADSSIPYLDLKVPCDAVPGLVG